MSHQAEIDAIVLHRIAVEYIDEVPVDVLRRVAEAAYMAGSAVRPPNDEWRDLLYRRIRCALLPEAKRNSHRSTYNKAVRSCLAIVATFDQTLMEANITDIEASVAAAAK